MVSAAWAQNHNLDFKHAVKIYNLTTFEEYNVSKTPEDTSLGQIEYTTTTTQIFHPTIAFQWKNRKGNFNEIELTNLSLGETRTETNTANGQKTDNSFKTTHISARYEYIYIPWKKKDNRLVPSLGFGINPYYKYSSNSPNATTSYDASEQRIGAKGFVTPRLTYCFSKLFVDINIPICVFNGYSQNYKDENPDLAVESRTIQGFHYYQLPKIHSGRIGVGLKI